MFGFLLVLFVAGLGTTLLALVIPPLRIVFPASLAMLFGPIGASALIWAAGYVPWLEPLFLQAYIIGLGLGGVAGALVGCLADRRARQICVAFAKAMK